MQIQASVQSQHVRAASYIFSVLIFADLLYSLHCCYRLAIVHVFFSSFWITIATAWMTCSTSQRRHGGNLFSPTPNNHLISPMASRGWLSHMRKAKYRHIPPWSEAHINF